MSARAPHGSRPGAQLARRAEGVPLVAAALAAMLSLAACGEAGEGRSLTQAAQAAAVAPAPAPLPEPVKEAPAVPTAVREIAGLLAEGQLLELADRERFARLDAWDEADLDALLGALSGSPVPVRVAALSALQVGAPYAREVMSAWEAPALAPAAMLGKTNCTVLNLLSTSLAHAGSLSALPDHVLVASYAPKGQRSFADRLHFTTDRLDRSPYFADVTADLAPPAALRSRRVVLNLRSDGKPWVQIPWQQEREVSWIPAGALDDAYLEALGRRHEVLGVAFVPVGSRKHEGLDVLHEGVLYRGQTLIHASQQREQVVIEPLSGFVRPGGRVAYAGVLLFEYR